MKSPTFEIDEDNATLHADPLQVEKDGFIGCFQDELKGKEYCIFIFSSRPNNYW